MQALPVDRGMSQFNDDQRTKFSQGLGSKFSNS